MKFSFDYTIEENLETPLLKTAKEACQKAYSPYSKFSVGVAILLENGKIVTGNNQENGAYPSGLCAERVAAFTASAQYPNVPFKEIVIVAYTNGEYLEKPISPCGACRQVLWEYESKNNTPIKTYLYGTKETVVISRIKDLLPFAFEL